MSFFKTIAKAGNKQIKNRVKQGVKMPEKEWKKWNVKVLDEEEIKIVVNNNLPNYNFGEFTDEQKDEIARQFQKCLSSDIADMWVWWIEESVKRVIDK